MGERAVSRRAFQVVIDPLIGWLEQCSVRILGDRPGTGFFVSPGRILTCAHVVGVRRAVGSRGIQVLWGELVDEDAEVAGIWPDPDDDLAILNVALSDHPCARLGIGAALDDELYACGFPDYGAGVQGDGLSGTLESLTRLSGAELDRWFIKLKGADVVPGFSGGPLLDRRTGEVIGIVTETRGSGSGLGGWAIPVEFAFTCAPQIADENGSFHARDPRWEANWREHLRLRVDLEEQRRARLAGLDAGLPLATAIDNFLAHYLGNPQAPEPFGGRGEVLRQLRAWFDDPRSAPYLLLLAPAGRGKSALLVRWYDELSRQAGAMDPPLELIFVPVSLRYELSSESAVFGALAARLSRLHGNAPPSPSLAGAALRDLASALLCRPLPSGKRLLVLVDGLDEGVGWDAGPASFPQAPAAGVRAVFSARLTAHRATPEAWLDRMGWRPDNATSMLLDPLEPAGVREVLERMGAPLAELASQGPLVTELYRLTKGDPLLLCLYSRDLWARGDRANRLSPSQLSEINPGIEGYFNQWWKDQQVQWGEGLASKKDTVQIVFNLLATALGPLPRRDLLKLARTVSPALTGDALDEALETLARFVVCDSTRQAYVLAHPRFAQYRYEKLAADGEEQAYERLFLDWGRETLEIAERDGDLSGLSPYIVQRFGAHLERSRRPAAERLRLVSGTWRRAWESHGEEHGGFVSDVESAWRAAAEADQAAVAAGEPPPFLAEELRCALFTAQASAAVELTDASLLSALASQGVWSAGRCLSFAFRLDSGRQAEALAALVPHLERTHLASAVAAVDRLFDRYFPDVCAPLIAALAVRFIELGDPVRALELARSRPGYARGTALIALLPYLSPEAQAAALGDALDDAASHEQGFLFAKLVELLASKVDRHALQDGSAFGARFIALLDLEQASGEQQSWRVAFAAPWLEAPERHRRLREVVDRLAARAGQRRGWEIFMTSEIVDLAAALEPELAEEVLARCVDRYSDDMAGYEARALIALLPRLPIARRQEVARRVLAVAPEAARLSGIDDRVDFFARLAAAGYGDRALEVIGEQKAGDWYTQDLIEGVVPFLDEPQTRVCLGLAERCRPETRAQARSAVLGRLASFGREQAREVLALCHLGDNPGDEEAAALLLLDLFSGKIPVPDVFRTLAGIQDEHLRLSAMVQVAAFFDQLDAEPFEIAVSSFGDTVRSVLAVEAIGLLAPYLTPAAVADARVVRAVRLPVENVAHGEKEAHLVPYFQRLAALGRVREGLAIGCGLATSSFAFPLFCALVGLAGACAGEELRSALDKAGEIEESEDYRVLALLALSPRAAEDLRQPLVRAAADHLASFDVGYLGLMSGKIAVVLGALPEPIRRRMLELIVTDDLLRSGSHLAADAQVRLLPFLSEEQVNGLRQNVSHESGTDQARLRAALAARLAALGRHEDGLELCRMLSGEHLIDALAGTLAVLPPDLLPAALDPAFRLPGYMRVRLGPAFASRWKDLSRRQLLNLVQGWLRRVSFTTRSDLLFDLVLFAWPLHRVGGKQAVSSVVEILRRA